MIWYDMINWRDCTYIYILYTVCIMWSTHSYEWLAIMPNRIMKVRTCKPMVLSLPPQRNLMISHRHIPSCQRFDVENPWKPIICRFSQAFPNKRWLFHMVSTWLLQALLQAIPGIQGDGKSWKSAAATGRSRDEARCHDGSMVLVEKC